MLRRLTQALAAMIYAEGWPAVPAYSGIRYVSRLGVLGPVSGRANLWPQRVIPLTHDDLALHDAARILHLDIETEAGATVTP